MGLAENFLTSRRAVYFYAFVLLAGILLFGLVLTIRSVNRELELARMQSDFVSTVSHEFKSPLTSIRQLAEMLQADMVPSEDRRRRYYDVLVEQSERLSMLIDNVLDFARMEAGRREMSRAAVDVKSLVEDIVTEAQHRVVHEGFTVRTESEDQLPSAFLDADAIRQALNNLIDNGVKYSGSSREVVVRSFRENAHIVIAVQDFGIGLAPEEAGKVFDRFYRGGGELTRSVKGTGLGLTLVKQIVGAHGGDVDVHSELGRGSTFSIRLPLVTDPAVTRDNGRT
jgi:signal transduction histidine kinase